MGASVSRTSRKVKEPLRIPCDPPVAARDLLRWYDRHRRVLPWRALPGQVADPYRVWLSEVMLQQTTVATVIGYFERFIARWPTVQALAAAERDDVLRLWAGLGYYRRAHLLHECAQVISRDYGGVFPATEGNLLALPGIGAYTAAAICAIAFDAEANVVDGNVERVIARVFRVAEIMPKAKGAIKHHAATLLPTRRYGDYAQALMDLGATVCTPRAPDCLTCPWRRGCGAHAVGDATNFPHRGVKQVRPVRHAVAFVVLDKQGRIFLQRRPTQGLLGGMMEVPSSPWQDAEHKLPQAVREYAPCKANWQNIAGEVEHVFSHFTLRVQVVVTQGVSAQALPGHWVALSALREEALPTVMRKVVRHGLRDYTVSVSGMRSVQKGKP